MAAELLTVTAVRASANVVDRLRRRLRAHRGILSEVLVVVAVLAVIQVVAFAGYWGGSASPSGDFLASYSNEAFAWWRDGGVLHPPEWVPFIWGGFPSAAQVQNSAWYLPTGLIAFITPYDITAAAIGQAIHVALGGLGVYVLGRQGGFGRVASMFALVAYSFTTGFFSSAPYPDIVRGFALLPWLLLCLSPLWPWRRPWAVPLAAVLLWQAAAGVYPGVLIAIGYTSVAWLIVWQLVARPKVRQFLLPLAFAGFIAVALSMPKFLPQLGLGTINRGSQQDLTTFGPTVLATLALPGFPGMPGVYSLNLLFVPAAVLILLPFASFRRPIVRATAAAFVVAVLFAVPQSPLRDVASQLPGVSSSRFRLNDYLAVLTMGATLAATSGLERIMGWFRQRPRVLEWTLRGFGAVLPLAAALFMLSRGPFRTGDWLPTTIALVVTTVAVLVITAIAGRVSLGERFARVLAGGALAVLALMSGLAHADTVRELWAIDTVAVQKSLWGSTSGELIAHRLVATGAQRPARSPADLAAETTPFQTTTHNSAFYTGSLSVGGYFSVHQSASYVESSEAMRDPTNGADASAFWAAPGMLVPEVPTSWGLPGIDEIQQCSTVGACASLSVEPVSYRPGSLSYQVSSPGPQTVLANEAFYPGWHVVLTDSTGQSREVTPNLGPAGSTAFALPAGNWRVSMAYVTPYRDAARASLVAGLAVLLAWLGSGLWIEVRRLRRLRG